MAAALHCAVSFLQLPNKRAKRPGMGKLGKQITVLANMFALGHKEVRVWRDCTAAPQPRMCPTGHSLTRIVVLRHAMPGALVAPMPCAFAAPVHRTMPHDDDAAV